MIFRFEEPARTGAWGYPLRRQSFAFSAGAHVVGILLLGVLSTDGSRSKRPIYDEQIAPYKDKIIFYRAPKKLPDTNPVKRVGNAPRPRGKQRSKQTIVASSRNARSKQQLIWQPAPKIQLPKDVPAPAMVARLDAVLPPPPPPPPKPKPRTFTPPKPINREPKLPVQAPILEARAPTIQSQSNPLLPRTNPSLVFSNVAAPPREAPVAPKESSGNAAADIAIVSARPVETASAELPNGARSAEFSKAPAEGPAASGEPRSSALTVPDLTIRNPPSDAPLPAEPPKMKTVVYAEKVRSVPPSTLSVPLRPANRLIPRAVDARFQGRNVYTMVVPIENLPAYGGDWIMWFAEKEPTPGTNPVVRAPVPYRKVEPAEQATGRDSEGMRAQVAGVLSREGKLQNVTVLSQISASMAEGIIQDVMSWEFRAATRNNAPVDVDIVFEIPFNLPLLFAKCTPASGSFGSGLCK
jgi:hypothetical protein